MSEKNVSINLIYWGFQHLVWVMDKLGYDYMAEWRNQMCQWMIELEKKYKWVGENQRSWGTCPCNCFEKVKNTNNGGEQ